MQREPIDEPTTSIKKQKRRQQAEAERQRRPMNGQQRAETKSQWRAALQYPPFLVQRFVGWLVCLFCNRSAPFASGLHFSFVRLASLFFCLLLLFFFYPKATKCRRHFPSPPPRVSSTFFFLFPFSFFFLFVAFRFFLLRRVCFLLFLVDVFSFSFSQKLGAGVASGELPGDAQLGAAGVGVGVGVDGAKQVDRIRLPTRVEDFFFFKKRSFENNKME